MAARHVLAIVGIAVLLAGCKEKQSPAETDAHLKAAKDLYAKADYTHALVEVQNAIRGDPKSGDAHYLAAQIQEGLNDRQAAFQEYARAAIPEANNLKAQLKVVEILIEAKQLDMALGRINGTLGAHPGNSDALALRALTEQRQGSRDKARGDAQAAVAHDTGQPVANAVLATDALMDKNADKALTLLAGALKAHPDDASLLQLKAAALLQQGKSDDAIAIYQGLVKMAPASAAMRATLAALDAAAGHADQGEQVLRDGVAAAPADRDMRVALVAYLAKSRGDAAADAELEAGIKAQPQDTALDLLRAEGAARRGKIDEATAILRGAIGRVPDGPARGAAQLALARLQISGGNEADARKLLDDMLAAKADNDDALELRASLMIKSHDPAHAIPDLLAVASRRPRASAPFALLADAYGQQGDLDKAADALKKVIYFEPAKLAPVVQLVSLDLKANKPDLAKQALADYVTRNPDAIDGRLALVRLAVQKQDWAGAQAAIDQMRRNPKFNKAVTLLNAELSEAKGQPALAMTAYARIMDEDPGKPVERDALAGYARVAVATKQIDQAAAYLSKLAAKAAKPDDAAIVDLALSAIYRASGDLAKAADARTAAIQAAPTLPGGYLDAAAALRASQPADAIAVLNKGLSAGAPAEPLLMARAAIEDQSGNKDAAISTYRDILKANPTLPVAANNYASLVADAKPSDKTLLADAREPIRRFAGSSNPAILDTLAWIDYRLGDYQSAKDLLIKAKADTSDSPQLRFHYGAVLMALGEKDAGRSALKGALGRAAFPGQAEAEHLLTE